MNSLVHRSVLILVIILVSICSVIHGQFEQQTKVPENRDCGCDGYVAKAKECSWTQQICDENSEVFANYQYWCGILNNFRDKKREGNIPQKYNRSLTCKSNLSKAERDVIDRSLIIPRSLPIWVDREPGIPFDAEVPNKTVDWTSQMTPVKKQGLCGSCWSFATVGYFEYWYKKKTGVAQSFSEQRLVSCDAASFGCNGGFQGRALDFLHNNGTVLTSDLPYTSGTTRVAGDCPETTKKLYKGPKTYYEWYLASGSSHGPPQNGNCTRLKQLLTHGPVVGSIYTTTGVQQYKSGVFTDSKCPTNGTTNHAIIITGFIKNYQNSGTDVFVVRNSWSSAWGVNGYMYIDAKGNPCGICSVLFYAL